MNPFFVSAAILLGAAIGWVLATVVYDFTWKRLYKTQCETLVHQDKALKTQREYTTKLKQVIEERDKATVEYDKAKALFEEANAALESAIAFRDRAEKAQ